VEERKQAGMANPVVSVIIITRNRPFLLRHCLQHILAQPYAQKEVIVVDSSANDESERVVADYPEVLSVRLRGQRHNMPQARNAGIALASGELLAFIDDDAMVQAQWLPSLVGAYEDTSVGAAGGRVIGIPAPYCDQHEGPPRLIVYPSGRVVAKDVGLLSAEPCEVDHLVGCNMSFRRKALEQVGGFDTRYTLTNLREETDLCVRVQRAGWRLLFVPSMVVLHFSARSLQPYFLERPGVQFSNGRNCSYFAVKNFGLTAQTLAGQCLDAGKSCGRAAYFVGLFSLGAVAHLAGRAVGLAEGVHWRMHKQRVAGPLVAESSESSTVPCIGANVEH
jgi:GT2 family glycosyltransferase